MRENKAEKMENITEKALGLSLFTLRTLDNREKVVFKIAEKRAKINQGISQIYHMLVILGLGNSKTCSENHHYRRRSRRNIF